MISDNPFVMQLVRLFKLLVYICYNKYVYNYIYIYTVRSRYTGSRYTGKRVIPAHL